MPAKRPPKNGDTVVNSATAGRGRKGLATVENHTAAGVPDWRQASQYNITKLSETGRIWECVRRSPSYRAEWQRAQADRLRFMLDFLVDPATRPPDETLRALFRSPELPKWKLSKTFAQFTTLEAFRDLEARHVATALRQVQADKEKVVLVFDLLKPLTAQLKNAEHFLGERKAVLSKRSAATTRPPPRTGMRRAHSHQQDELGEEPPRVAIRSRTIANLGECLRVVDARNAGITFAEIGRALYPKIDPDDAVSRARARFNVMRQFWRLHDPWR